MSGCVGKVQNLKRKVQSHSLKFKTAVSGRRRAGSIFQFEDRKFSACVWRQLGG